VRKDRADGASSLLGGAAKYGEHIGNIAGNIEDNIGRYGNRTCQEYIFRFYQQKWFADWYETKPSNLDLSIKYGASDG